MTYTKESDRPGCSNCLNNAASAADDEQQTVRKKVKGRRFKIEAVLREEIVRERLSLTEYHAVTVPDRSKIGSLLQILPPMPPEANHLKRINKNGQILIQSAIEPLSEELVENLQSTLRDVSVGKVEVPACKPITRRQFLWAKQHWPTSFHPNKAYEAMLDGTFFTTEEYRKIIDFFLEAEKIGNGGPGCVIVDLNGEIAVKSGVRNVPLGHAVMAAVSDLCENHRTGGSDVLQYLGTGYDVYMTNEPCAMCAMALVHFRVGRVFYGKRSPGCGAYESCWRIQDEKSLNHHYAVFRIDELL